MNPFEPPKPIVYFYRTVSGTTYFSNGGIKKDDAHLAEYLRMLRYARYPIVQLHLDNPEDFAVICNLFNIHGKTWQEIYNEL